MHLRIMVEQAVRCGKSEREIEALLRQAEADDQAGAPQLAPATRRLAARWPGPR